MTRTFCLIAALLTVLPSVPQAAAGFQVLTAGKMARFVNRGDAEANGGVVRIGADRALETLYDPRCPAVSAVEVEAYLQSTYRDAILASATLDCAKWKAASHGFIYRDPAGTVRSVFYGHRGLRIEVKGPGFTPIEGPVGYVQAQLRIGDELLRARFHNFRRNDGAVTRSRRPSIAAAAGEAGFWDVILGDDDNEATEQATIHNLETAAEHDGADGRSRFLLAMMHLYRFGQLVTDYSAASDAAKAELREANVWFAESVPLLWDDSTATGDSRVPGFAAAAKYTQGVVEGDLALRDEGLADLDRAVQVNAFFNVFDYIPVIQAAAPADPLFQAAYEKVTAYLSDPETLACVISQPEICANAGFAPRNIQGALTLFGDVYAKAGDLEQARTWYSLVAAFPDTRTWQFSAISADRVANAAARVALYQDTDPSNDPPIIGAGAEACAVCHKR